jgi:hypothetical protein
LQWKQLMTCSQNSERMSTTEVEVQEIQPSFGKESKGGCEIAPPRGFSEGEGYNKEISAACRQNSNNHSIESVFTNIRNATALSW